jgi:hypothetical protein
MAATTQVKVAAFGTSEPLDGARIRAGCLAPIAISTGGILTRLLEAVSATCLNERPRHPARFSSKLLKEYSEASDARRVGLSLHRDDEAEDRSFKEAARELEQRFSQSMNLVVRRAGILHSTSGRQSMVLAAHEFWKKWT